MLAQPKILLVEDAVISRKVVCLILTELNCIVHAAATGEEAIQQCRENQYDLIFMDIGLPDASGFEVAKTLRIIDSPNRNTWIIALTAHADKTAQAAFKAAGVDGLLCKPLIREQANVVLEQIQQRGTCDGQ